MLVTKQKYANAQGRVAIVDAVRTPFCKIATHYRDMNAIDLGQIVVQELVVRNQLDVRLLDQLVFGMTVMMPEAPFIAREIALACGYTQLDAYSITRACATSFQTTASLADHILAGTVGVGIAGGTDSTSSVRIPLSAKLSAVLRDVNFAKTHKEKIRLLAQLSVKDILPQAPSITEYSVGETMGQSTEKMVKKWHVDRAEQDDIAHASHSNAAAAWAQGKMQPQVVPVTLANGRVVTQDNQIRLQSNRADYTALKPVFDRSPAGSVTAGNSSPLTDGAAALLLMSEKQAKALGYTPLGYIKSYAFAAKSPQDDLLMGPVLAAPIALKRAGVSLQDISLFEMHEAFAGQLACNLRGLNDRQFFADYLPDYAPLGEVDRQRLNVNGGSLAYGHPFGATGARVIMQALYELRARGGGLALATACAAGGVGAAMVLESE